MPPVGATVAVPVHGPSQVSGVVVRTGSMGGGAMMLAGIGMALAALGVKTDGQDYPPELAGTDDLPRNTASLPNLGLGDRGIEV